MTDTPTVAAVAHGYNAPDRKSDTEAYFNDLASAQAYADKYGGTIEGRGVAFVVGPDADHDTARDDLAELQKAAPAAAPAVQSDIDAAVARAIDAERAKLRAEFEADRQAWLDERAKEQPETPVAPEPSA